MDIPIVLIMLVLTIVSITAQLHNAFFTMYLSEFIDGGEEFWHRCVLLTLGGLVCTVLVMFMGILGVLK